MAIFIYKAYNVQHTIYLAASTIYPQTVTLVPKIQQSTMQRNIWPYSRLSSRE